LKIAFDSQEARPQWISNYELLGVSPFVVRLGQLREVWLKPLVWGLGVVVLLLFAGLGLGRLLAMRFHLNQRRAAMLSLVVSLMAVTGVLVLALSPEWFSYLLVRRFTLDANHAWVSLVCFGLPVATALLPAKTSGWPGKALRLLGAAIWLGLIIAAVSGLLMFAKLEALASLTRLAYTGLELGLVVALAAAALVLFLRQWAGRRGLGSVTQ